MKEKKTSQTSLAKGNEAFRQGDYAKAIANFAMVITQQPGLAKSISANLALARKKYRASRQASVKPSVAVCGWELAHNAAGRVYTLATIYQTFADVEIIGSLFPSFGREIWEPIRDTAIAKHTFIVEDESKFIEQAIQLVALHPYDIVHLSKPRLPNIIFGTLYKLFWDAKVLMDIDDEELAFVGAEAPISIDDYILQYGRLPELKNLIGKDWTRLAVGLAKEFDGVTVSNGALQRRYGGEMIRHARDEMLFKSSQKLKLKSREKYGIPQDAKVVLFFGTPREHKGLIETAQAIANLKRPDVVYCIVGSFPDEKLKMRLLEIKGCNYKFLPDQLFSNIHQVYSMADCCVMLQDINSPVSAFQTPAKLTDALLMKVPVLVSGIIDADMYINAGLVINTDKENIQDSLNNLLNDCKINNNFEIKNLNKLLMPLTIKYAGGVVIEILNKMVSSKWTSASLKKIASCVFSGNNGLEFLFCHDCLESLRFCANNVTKMCAEIKRGRDKDMLRVGSNKLTEIFSDSVCKSVFFKYLKKIVLNNTSNMLTSKLVESERRLESAAKKVTSLWPAETLVSVIMPTYNRADIILNAIASVREQSWTNWELLVCDDGSTDSTDKVVADIKDTRIRYIKLQKFGAAAARNAGLRASRGEIVTYLDSDNFWHPHYIARILCALGEESGKLCCYADYIDFEVSENDTIKIKSFERPIFDHEKLLNKNYIDLNTFAHRRELYDLFGGFSENLVRRQDYDLIIKYTWIRDPIKINDIVALYQRNHRLSQITQVMKHDESCTSIIQKNIDRYLNEGLSSNTVRGVKRVTIISWDLCRNHFSKPFALAEALSKSYDVTLVSFRFFEEKIFPPLNGVVPQFKTVYLQGRNFPDYFKDLFKAVEAIDADIVYVVKPRLPSLGLALLANVKRNIPIILEINDLETVVASPKKRDTHGEAVLNPDLADFEELKNPFSDTWSRVMDPIAKQLPVLVTHNKGLDGHFNRRCLYMRNLKDESVYDPEKYDRDTVRYDLGFTNKDRVILFGGLLRKHKGIYELVELIERLNDPVYKLLFVGSRVTPDQKKLVERFGDQIRVLPPQDRESMARINLAADLVILWLNPDVPASHYQMPYKATDAFAMGTHVIANDISDLGDLSRQGYLTQVPFGDWAGMIKAIQRLFEDPIRTSEMRVAARRLFLRQFSYAAARSCFALAANRALSVSKEPLPVAKDFAERFNVFYRRLLKTNFDFINFKSFASLKESVKIYRNDIFSSIRVLDSSNFDKFQFKNTADVAVVMPSVDVKKALETSKILLQRAGAPVTIFVAEDIRRQGFIKTLNDVSANLDVRYIVYLAEDAFPGIDWLKLAYNRLEETGKGLLAFNCGKWRGRIAAFGMVRVDWIKQIYGGPILYPHYKAHKADNEITIIARLLSEYIYEPNATLIEIDPRKTGSNDEVAPTSRADRKLFTDRFYNGFDGLFSVDDVIKLEDEYLNQRRIRNSAHVSYADNRSFHEI